MKLLREIDTKKALKMLEDNKQSWKVYYKDKDTYKRVIDRKWSFEAHTNFTLFKIQLYEEVQD